MKIGVKKTAGTNGKVAIGKNHLMREHAIHLVVGIMAIMGTSGGQDIGIVVNMGMNTMKIMAEGRF
jgi:hypothetical protein